MADHTRKVAPAIVAGYDFSPFDLIADLGGGHGALLAEILRSDPDIAGVVVDRPQCRSGAEAYLAEAGLADRCRFVAADLFTDDLPAASLYVAKNVIHDWDDQRAIALLRRVREHMTPDARLILIETVMPDVIDDTPAGRRTLWADLRMLIATGGLERTEADFTRLLEAASLEMTRVLHTPANTNIADDRAGDNTIERCSPVGVLRRARRRRFVLTVLPSAVRISKHACIRV